VRAGLAALVVLALAVRVVGVLATPGYLPQHDDRDYDRLACWIAHHGVPPGDVPSFPTKTSCAETGPRGTLTAYRPPLWPIALGATYAVAEPLHVDRWTAGRLVQALLGTAIAVLTGAIAARLWNRTTGLIALALTAVFLPLVLDGLTLISEPLFVALELGALLAALQFRHSGRARAAILAGVLVGLAALTRSNGALLALPLLLVIGTRSRASAAAFAAAAVLVVLPWTIRNAVVLHAFVPVSTESGPTLLGTYNPAARAVPGCTGCWVLLSKTPGEEALATRLKRLTEVQRDAESRRLALRFAERHPAYVLQVAWGNSVRLLELAGAGRTRFTATTIDVSPGLAVLGAHELWLVLALIAAGLLAGAHRRIPAPLVALIAFLWLTTVLVQSETPRFRAALDPFLLMLAAVGVASALRLSAGQRSRASHARART
jgi:4-amino-4-deoxy-L-arabinose transferase-like glycosyltransferase